MSHRILSAGKLARSLFFIGFVGGLLFFVSYTFSHVANNYFYNTLSLQRPVSILEVAGVLSFIYVIAFGFKFGLNRGPRYDEIVYTQIDMDAFSDKKTEDCEELETYYKKQSRKLTDEQKEKLKEKLAEICGIDPGEEKSTHNGM